MSKQEVAAGLSVISNMELVKSQTGSGLPTAPKPRAPKPPAGVAAPDGAAETVAGSVADDDAPGGNVETSPPPQRGLRSVKKPTADVSATSMVTRRTVETQTPLTIEMRMRLSEWEIQRRQARESAVYADLLESMVDELRERDKATLAKWIKTSYRPLGRKRPGEERADFNAKISEDHANRLDVFCATMLRMNMKVPRVAVITWMLDRTLPELPASDDQ